MCAWIAIAPLEGNVNLKIDIGSKREAGSEMALPSLFKKVNISADMSIY
jgi:hypothetical protein